MKDLYISNKTMGGLDKCHIKELKKQRMWDALMTTQQNLIESNEVQVGSFLNIAMTRSYRRHG